MKNNNTSSKFAWIIWVIAFLLAAIFIFIKVDNWGPSLDAPEQSDFAVYYYSARISKIAPEFLYHNNMWEKASDGEFGNLMPFLYIPAYAIFLRPLGDLPYDTARRIWFWSSIIAITVTVMIMHRNIQSRRVFFIGVLLWLLNPSALDTLFLGQVNAFLALLLTLSCIGLGNPRVFVQFLTGMCLGFVCAIKPFPIGLAVYAFSRKHYSYVAGVVIGVLLLIGVGITGLPFEVTRDYINVILGVSAEYTPPGMPMFWNQSIAAFWSKLSMPIDSMITTSPPPNPMWATVLGVISNYVLALFTIRVLQLLNNHDKQSAQVLEISLVLITMLLLIPLTWWHYLLITSFVFIAIAEIIINQSPTWWQSIAIPAGYVLILVQRGMERFVPLVRIFALSSLTMFGLLIWWVCVAHTLKYQQGKSSQVKISKS